MVGPSFHPALSRAEVGTIALFSVVLIDAFSDRIKGLWGRWLLSYVGSYQGWEMLVHISLEEV